MRKLGFFLMLLLHFSCRKELGVSGSYTPSNGVSNPSSSKDTSYVHVSINQIPMVVQTIIYDRGSNTVHFEAANGLEKVDVYTFNFYGTSGLNYQYQDSITYSVRKDIVSQWQTARAPYATTDVRYDCCALPTKDSPVDGTFSADFGIESNLSIQGNFHLRFPSK